MRKDEKWNTAAVAWRHARLESLLGEEVWRGLYGRLMMTPPARPLDTAEHEILASHALRTRAETKRDTGED